MTTLLSLVFAAITISHGGKEVVTGEAYVHGPVLFVVGQDSIFVAYVDWDGIIHNDRGQGNLERFKNRDDTWHFDLPTRWWSNVPTSDNPRPNPRTKKYRPWWMFKDLDKKPGTWLQLLG